MKILWEPNVGPQTTFLSTTVREVMYGGAAGGGKSDALLVAPLRWVHNPNHRAIILRRTSRELQELKDRTRLLYPEVVEGADWNENRSRWLFPSGAIIQLGFAEHADDINNFKSNQYNFIGFDELTTFEKKMYDFMWSRNRSADPSLPLQMRSATNPGDIGHEWVFKRFVKDKEPYKVYTEQRVHPDGQIIEVARQFIPATVYDNPKLGDHSGYVAGLMEMDEDLRNAMLFGRWDVFEGQFFRKMPTIQEPVLKSENYYVIRCMDYGLNDPSAIYWIVVYPEFQILEVVAEIYERDASLPELCRMIAEKEKELQEKYGLKPPQQSVGDPNSMFRREGTSMQTIAQIMARHGQVFNKANDDRAAGWAMFKYVLEQEKLRVWKNQAPHLMATLPTLKYAQNKKDDLDQRGATQDHAADSIRYGLLAWWEDAPTDRKSGQQYTENQDKVFPKIIKDLKLQQQRGDDPFADLF